LISDEYRCLISPNTSLLARKAEGSVRDSLSLLDQVAAFAGDKITEPDVVDALGLVDRKSLFDFVEAVAATDRRKVLTLTRAVFDGGIDVTDFVVELLEHFRCLIILKADPENGSLLEFTAEELNDYRKQADFFEMGDLLRLVKTATDLYDDFRRGIDQRLLLETAAVKMAEMESTVRFEEILALLQGQTNTGRGGTTQNNTAGHDLFGASGRATSPKPAPTGATDQTAPATAPASSRSLNMPIIRSGWESFLAVLKKSSPMLASQVRMAELRSIIDNELQMFFAASGDASRQLVTKPDHLRLIQQTLRDCYRANLTVSFDIDHNKQEPLDGDGEKKPEVDPQKLVENSPRLKNLLEKVDGEIIGIKKADN